MKRYNLRVETHKFNESNAFHVHTYTDNFSIDSVLSECNVTDGNEDFIKEYISDKGVNTALSLDLSKTSSGIVLLVDNKLYTFTVSLDVDSEDWNTEFALSEGIRHIIKEVSKAVPKFDLVTVEANVLGSNHAIDFVTLRKLIVMNYVIDGLIQDNTVKTDEFYRINVVSWQSDLSYLANNVAKHLKSKQKIRYSLSELGYSLARETMDMKESRIKSSGVQDMLDAMGILLSACMAHNGEKQEKSRTRRKKKSKKLDFNYYLFNSYQSLCESDLYSLASAYNDGDEPIIIHTRTRSLTKKILEELEKLIVERGDEYPKVIIRTTTLGDFGISQQIDEQPNTTYYIYVEASYL